MTRCHLLLFCPQCFILIQSLMIDMTSHRYIFISKAECVSATIHTVGIDTGRQIFSDPPSPLPVPPFLRIFSSSYSFSFSSLLLVFFSFFFSFSSSFAHMRSRGHAVPTCYADKCSVSCFDFSLLATNRKREWRSGSCRPRRMEPCTRTASLASGGQSPRACPTTPFLMETSCSSASTHQVLLLL